MLGQSSSTRALGAKTNCHPAGTVALIRLSGALLLGAVLFLSGCGGGSGGTTATATGGTTAPGGTTTPTTPLTYTIGGTITGLLAGTGLVLQNNGANDLTVAANSVAFTFPVGQADASTYSVTIKTQPTGKTCGISGDTGTVAAANVTGIALTCVSNGQKFGFVANSNNNSVYGFSLDTTTGAATSVGTIATGGLSSPASIAVTPSGRFLYVANNATGKVSAFGFSVTNVLSVVTGSPFTAGNGPYSVAVAPNQISLSAAKVVYVANSTDNTVSTFTVNNNGSLTALGAATATGTFPRAIVVDASGKFAYVVNFNSANVSAFTIDATTGGLVPVAGSPFATGTNTPVVTQPQSIAVDPLTKFAYVTNTGENTISLFTLDSTTGAMTANGPDVTALAGPSAITIDPTGAFVYVSTTNGILGFTLDPATGLLTAMAGSPFNTGNNFSGVSVNAGSTFLYATNTSNGNLDVFSITAGTGVLTDLLAPVAIPAGTGALLLPITTTR